MAGDKELDDNLHEGLLRIPGESAHRIMADHEPTGGARRDDDRGPRPFLHRGRGALKSTASPPFDAQRRSRA